MGRRRIAKALLVACLAGTVGAGVAEGTPGGTDWEWLIVADGPSAATEREALVRSLKRLPRLPVRIAVLDAERARPDVKPVLLRLDAFVVKGRPEVYVVRQSSLLRCAIRQAPLCTHAMAAVIWHEMAHVDGADERAARRLEEAMWTTFVRDQQVDPVAALRYLDAMVHRPHDHLVASR